MSKTPLKSRIGATALLGALIFAYLAYDEANLQGVVSFFGSHDQAAVAGVHADQCFQKEQTLENSVKQGVNICLEEELDTMSFEYYSVTTDGQRQEGLVDREKFREFFTGESIEDQVATAQGMYEQGQEQGKAVKGINNSTALKFKRTILQDLQTLDSND